MVATGIGALLKANQATLVSDLEEESTLYSKEKMYEYEFDAEENTEGNN